MLLTITTTHQPASELGYLLHKHPGRSQSFPLAFGQAHIFYPEVSEERCTAALLLEIDPIGLVRDRRGAGDAALEPYVNDRPYVASSFLSVAINEVLRNALNGQCRERPALAGQALPLTTYLPMVPSHGGEGLLRSLFEPLGYTVAVQPHPLDARFPEWGLSPYWSLTLSGSVRLAELLTHLYVLLPVLDDDKHYWVGDDEVDKLLRRGQGWLAEHGQRELIASRYLRHRRHLTRDALRRLSDEDQPDPDAAVEQAAVPETIIEERLSLHQQRLAAVMAVLTNERVTSVLDLGCGEGRLLQALLAEASIRRIVGVDVAYRALERAAERLRLDRLPPLQRERITLLHGALTYRDKRLAGFEAAAVVEVIEHLDPPRLSAFERVLFGQARPQLVVITTPNREYNVRFEGLAPTRLRHRDHRFEWTRAEFQDWATLVASQYGYGVVLQPIGPWDEAVGAPSQMAIFKHTGQPASMPAPERGEAVP